MDQQLRIYTLKPGRLEGFVALWREHVVPARQAHGFVVEHAWWDPELDRFTWIVSHPGDFAAADAAYYASPERAGLPRNPGDDLAEVATRMLKPLP